MKEYLEKCNKILNAISIITTITTVCLYFKASPEQRECIKLIYKDKNVKRYKCKDGTVKMYIK